VTGEIFFFFGEVGPRLVRTGDYAIPATNAFILVNPDYPILTLLISPGGADIYARGDSAMVAPYGICRHHHIWIFTLLQSHKSWPGHFRRKEMLNPAGHNTRKTTHTPC
jgi:hypothetical protein